MSKQNDRPTRFQIEDQLAELASADKSYQSFPSFQEFSAARVPYVEWDQALARLNSVREHATSDQIRKAVEVTMRAAAINTGAIEDLYDVDRGFTISVAYQQIAWQAGLSGKGESVRELFLAQLEAYDLALDVATRREPITEVWIRSLHEVLGRPQQTIRVLTQHGWQEQPFQKGQYKTVPNHVVTQEGTVHAYAPVVDTPAEMHRLIDQIQSEPFERGHPILQAAYAHYALVAIHPFADGNGRVARALASVYLYRSASIPLVIFDDQKNDYFDVLAAADRGKLEPLFGFFVDRVVDTMGTVADDLVAVSRDTVDKLRVLLTAHAGLSHAEIDRIGYLLLDTTAESLRERASQLSLPEGVAIGANKLQGGGRQPPADDPGFRALASQGPQWIHLSGHVPPPAQANVMWDVDVVVSKKEQPSFAFRVVVQGAHSLDVRLSDVYPEQKSSFALRLSAWSGRVVGELLESLLTQSEQTLKAQGYMGL